MASTGEVWRLGRRPALDGVRAIAVLLVVLDHSNVPGFDSVGAVGVDVFFVLSGFLITSLLLEDLDASGRLDFAGFYRRRAVRLMPALLVLVGAVAAFGAVLGLGGWWLSPGQAVGALTYTTNLLRLTNGWNGALTHTWSLGLEEQFYLTWPWVLPLLWRRGGWRGALAGSLLLGVASVAILACLVYSGASWWRIQFDPMARACLLLAGAGLAAALPLWPRLRVELGSRNVPMFATCGLVVAAASRGLLSYLAGPMVAVFAALLIGSVAERPPRALTAPWMLWLGRRSYGIYLWHYPVSVLTSRAGVPFVPAFAITLTVGVGCAALSWRFIEEPLLRRYAKRAASGAEALQGEPVLPVR